MLSRREWRRAAGALAAIAAFTVCAQEICVACHGADGNSPSPDVPSIAAQPKRFLENQLVLIREELRPAPQMLSVVKGLKDAQITLIAEHFSKLPARSMESGKPDPKLVKRGRERAGALRCGVCHLANYKGQNQVPRLAAQREAYLAAQMRAYRDNKRAGGDTIMAAVLYGVSDPDIAALAHYLSRLQG